MNLSGLLDRVTAFKKEAHNLLSVHESSRSRAIILELTYKRINGLSMQERELLQQSLRCVENQLFRPAHILAWLALMDLLETKMSSDAFQKVNSAYPKWQITSLEHLRETISEYQILEASKQVDLIRSKADQKILHGLLGKRNLCAHPSQYSPDLNMTLGFIADVLYFVEGLEKATYP